MLKMISLTKIITFVDSHLRPIECGEQLIKAQYFVKYGIVKENDKEIEIAGLCLQSSNIRDEPHKIIVVLSLSKDVMITKSSCTCKAGLTGKCKHCVGLLIILSR
jgi:hypothetical protein